MDNMRLKVKSRFWIFLPLFAGLLLIVSARATATEYGFTNFPYDFTAEALNETHKRIKQDTSLFAIHLDECLPWKNMLNDKPIPADLKSRWQATLSGIPVGHKVYVGLAPLAHNRETLVEPCGGESFPNAIKDRKFDNPKVMKAYLNYVMQAVNFFKPDYLNVGIEVDGVVARKKSDWPRFITLFKHVYNGVKKHNKNIQVGVSFTSHALLVPSIAKRAKPLVEVSDYLGLSLYPYASSFGEQYGYPSLGKGKERWRNQFEYFRNYTDKPIAICETGFTSKDVKISQPKLFMPGSEQEQADYVHDLIRVAKKDNYMFVVYYLAIDYDKLYAKMPKSPATEVNLLWRNIGLYDGNLKAKPALNEWRKYKTLSTADLKQVSNWTDKVSAVSDSKMTQKIVPSSSASALAEAPFKVNSDLPNCAPGGSVFVETKQSPASGKSAFRWSFTYGSGWQWCVKSLDQGFASGASKLVFWAKSDREGTVFFNIDETGGEAFFAMVPVDDSWQKVELVLSELSVDEKKKKDGNLDPEKIKQILIADPGAGAGSTGKRTLWVSGMEFHR